ncbi:MAG: hypothetical protein ACI4AD_00365 [Roseburia sp.]
MVGTEENYLITNEVFDRIQDLNYSYENVVKVLLATIESLSESMPISIFNESRAFTDHLARCYVNCTDKSYVDEQLDRAERHLNRMIMDCYKELFIIYSQRIEEFKKYVRRIDVSYVNDGKFYVEYKQLLTDAENKKIEAKKCVSYEEDYLKFEEACVAYSTLDEYIQEHLLDVQKIKVKNDGKKVIAFLAWLVTTVISAVLANNNQSIIQWFSNLIA